MAAVSIFDIFKIGIGPSSSHTVGPMKAAGAFARSLEGLTPARLETTLYGSLAFTGRGHGTDTAVVLGLSGAEPDSLDPDTVPGLLAGIRESGRLSLPSGQAIDFVAERDIVFNFSEELPRHTNGMRFRAFSREGDILKESDYYSLGGGFIARGDEPEESTLEGEPVYSYSTSQELLDVAATAGLSIAELVLANEEQWQSAVAVERGLRTIWESRAQAGQAAAGAW